MLFNSYLFLGLFLPAALAAFYAGYAYRRKFALALLLLASLIFYSGWNIAYLPLLLGSITLTYFISCAMQRTPGASRAWMWVGIVLNLAILGYYKYASFIYANTLGLHGAENPFTDIILPLGISFYTFQQIAYLVDIRKHRFDVPAPQTFALSITFFPHLIAGPIILFRNMRNQIESRRDISRADLIRIRSGLILFAIGLAKKVLIADSIAPFAKSFFDFAPTPGYDIGWIDAWIGGLAYMLQLYFDFSGYSDMAVGLARMFGFRIPFNFNSPYKATSPIDFWRRWHISLMYFFREYLYIPLGGNRKGLPRQILNILFVFLVTGLWHGAGWTFITWGCLWGVLVVLNHVWRRFIPPLRANLSRLARSGIHIAQWLLTMYAVLLLWIVFRSDSLETAMRIIRALAFQAQATSTCIHPDFGMPCGRDTILPIMALLLFVTAWMPNSRAVTAWLQRRATVWPAALFTGTLLYLAIASIARIQSEFLYFQF